MKLSDFQMVKTTGRSAIDLVYFAEVTVSTGILWWRKETRRTIRRKYAGSWHFADNGEFTPGFQAQALERAWDAQQALSGHNAGLSCRPQENDQ